VRTCQRAKCNSDAVPVAAGYCFAHHAAFSRRMTAVVNPVYSTIETAQKKGIMAVVNFHVLSLERVVCSGDMAHG
jgi:hypothetical protein